MNRRILQFIWVIGILSLCTWGHAKSLNILGKWQAVAAGHGDQLVDIKGQGKIFCEYDRDGSFHMEMHPAEGVKVDVQRVNGTWKLEGKTLSMTDTTTKVVQVTTVSFDGKLLVLKSERGPSLVLEKVQHERKKKKKKKKKKK